MHVLYRPGHYQGIKTIFDDLSPVALGTPFYRGVDKRPQVQSVILNATRWLHFTVHIPFMSH